MDLAFESGGPAVMTTPSVTSFLDRDSEVKGLKGLTEDISNFVMFYSASLTLVLSRLTRRQATLSIQRVRSVRRIVWNGGSSRDGSRRAGAAAGPTPPNRFEGGHTHHGCHHAHGKIR